MLSTRACAPQLVPYFSLVMAIIAAVGDLTAVRPLLCPFSMVELGSECLSFRHPASSAGSSA